MRCSAHENGQQCRATANLTNVCLKTHRGGFSSLVLPEYVSIQLCERHFVFTDSFSKKLRFNRYDNLEPGMEIDR
jgi:hypothetical protein